MEPTLEGIEDFNDQESSQKRSIVKKVVIALLIMGIFYTAAKFYFSTVSDEIVDVDSTSIYK